jgi:hypothetical protein
MPACMKINVFIRGRATVGHKIVLWNGTLLKRV